MALAVEYSCGLLSNPIFLGVGGSDWYSGLISWQIHSRLRVGGVICSHDNHGLILSGVLGPMNAGQKEERFQSEKIN